MKSSILNWAASNLAADILYPQARAANGGPLVPLSSLSGSSSSSGEAAVESPSALSVYSPADADTYANRDVYDEYLSYLQKGANIGLFSTAQDVADQAQLDRDFQALEAQKERDWYTDLSNTAYQRQVADLEAAGLNPILGFAHGAGSGAAVASTAVPSGRSTNLSAMAPSLADYINAGANLISSASDLLAYITPRKTSSVSKNLTALFRN